jgi:hypothetical protein
MDAARAAQVAVHFVDQTGKDLWALPLPAGPISHKYAICADGGPIGPPSDLQLFKDRPVQVARN